MSLGSLCTTHKITFESPSITTDLSGGSVRVWTEVEDLVEVSCTIQPIAAKERILYAQRQILLTDRIYLPAHYANLLRRTYRIKDVSIGAPTSPYRYFIILNWMDQAGRGVFTSIDVREFSD